MDMRTVGDKTHSHDSNCIYSSKSNGDFIEFSLSNANKEQLALFQLRSWLTNNLLRLLIGLQHNTLYLESNQCVTGFL